MFIGAQLSKAEAIRTRPWAELICAVISLLAAAIIGKKQYCQSRCMEEFERRQDERDERRHAEENKAQVVEFISRYYSDRG